MPIADSELDKSANAHLLRPAADTIYQAVKSWRDTPDSFEWWWLIIEHSGQRYTAIRFETLRDLLKTGGASMNTHLDDLPSARENPADWDHPFPGVVSPNVVEQSSVGTALAVQMVRDSPGSVLVVVNNGQFRGILAAHERTFAFADVMLLDMLEEYEQQPEQNPDAPVEPPQS